MWASAVGPCPAVALGARGCRMRSLVPRIPPWLPCIVIMLVPVPLRACSPWGTTCLPCARIQQGLGHLRVQRSPGPVTSTVAPARSIVQSVSFPP
eukprot:9235873-Prorocentrum_lima.AAC.1